MTGYYLDILKNRINQEVELLTIYRDNLSPGNSSKEYLQVNIQIDLLRRVDGWVNGIKQLHD